MFEKVNPSHPDKIADRIAGAIVDIAYKLKQDPHIAVEVLIGHHKCAIIIESDITIPEYKIHEAVYRIAGYRMGILLTMVPQDEHLHTNQDTLHCGDNGIFRGAVVTNEQQLLTNIAGDIYKMYPSDGKYILRTCNHGACYETIICQSNVPENKKEELRKFLEETYCIGYNIINPLGEWTGGTDVDSGATNRKLGSDMGDGITGGGLHGKDLSKADVSVNIFTWLMANDPEFIGPNARIYSNMCKYSCAIGDDAIYRADGDKIPYTFVVKTAREYIQKIGGFEKFAEWGLIRPKDIMWDPRTHDIIK